MHCDTLANDPGSSASVHAPASANAAAGMIRNARSAATNSVAARHPGGLRSWPVVLFRPVILPPFSPTLGRNTCPSGDIVGIGGVRFHAR
jgi:hypothetical protein